eukprot:2088006-Prymnesium_polylepis.1
MLSEVPAAERDDTLAISRVRVRDSQSALVMGFVEIDTLNVAAATASVHITGGTRTETIQWKYLEVVAEVSGVVGAAAL